MCNNTDGTKEKLQNRKQVHTVVAGHNGTMQQMTLMCQTHETVETPENRINCGTDVRIPKRLPDIVFPNTISTIHVNVITTQYTENE